jgi:hypothetical protein
MPIIKITPEIAKRSEMNTMLIQRREQAHLEAYRFLLNELLQTSPLSPRYQELKEKATTYWKAGKKYQKTLKTT